MLTQCPNCQTTFRITSEILRVAHGQVRCGRCHTQFDAVERLIEEEVAEATPQAPEPQIEVEEPAEQEDITLEGRRIEISGTYRVMDDSEQPQFHQEVTEEWVEFDEPEYDEATAATDDNSAAEEDPDSAGTYPVDPETSRFSRRLEAAAARQQVTEAAEEEIASITPVSHNRPTALVWYLLALPLFLLLLGQIVHHYRAELARHPRVGPPLMKVYAALGVPLTPDWHLHSYEIKQWGVVSDATHPGTLKVRASITNRAVFAQPYPLLKLVLEDRWGEQVRAREFEPAEYLDPGTVTDRLLAPGQPVNATIVIVDPGADAEGFRFDVCLKGKATGPVCAAEVPAAG